MFDAHAIARSLAAAGLDSAQVDAPADAIRQAAAHDRAEYATRTDVGPRRGDVRRTMRVQAAAIVGAVSGALRFPG